MPSFRPASCSRRNAGFARRACACTCRRATPRRLVSRRKSWHGSSLVRLSGGYHARHPSQRRTLVSLHVARTGHCHRPRHPGKLDGELDQRTPRNPAPDPGTGTRPGAASSIPAVDAFKKNESSRSGAGHPGSRHVRLPEASRQAPASPTMRLPHVVSVPY